MTINLLLKSKTATTQIIDTTLRTATSCNIHRRAIPKNLPLYNKQGAQFRKNTLSVLGRKDE